MRGGVEIEVMPDDFELLASSRWFTAERRQRSPNTKDKTTMKKIEALELEEEDLEDKRAEGSSSPHWKLKDAARRAMQESSLVVFSGQVVKNRAGRITSDLGQMLENW